MKQPCVYILTNKRYGTLYIGVTSDLARRIWEHKNNVIDGFTKKHGLHLLVYAEPHDTMEAAIVREKQLKLWKREWKINLIQSTNQNWRDLYAELCA
ncbi:GIY-YIG nuclease family protein [Magnetovibrio sp. PR-2]|uniref:GIY-YIG nuclease family protein n=1 Tax=Magnetovibrio sp. PR-2 TaxID=3120356 RepID=UPI002FCDF3C3